MMTQGRETPEGELESYLSSYHAYLNSLSAATSRRMSAALRRAAKILGVDPEEYPWGKLDPEQVALVRDKLTAQGAAPTTINVALTAMRGAARAAYGQDPAALTREEIQRLDAIRSVQNLPVKRESAPGLRHSAIKALFDAGAGYHVVQRVIGPVGLATLARYDPRNAEPLPAAHYTHSSTLAHNSTPYHRW